MSEFERTRNLASHLGSLRWSDLPPGSQDRVKDYVIDALAAGIAGAATDISRTLLSLRDRQAMPGTAQVWGTPHAVSPEYAALFNASSIHGYDLDAVHDAAIVHAYTCSTPAAMAVAESMDLDGGQMLLATLAGAEVAVRLGLASTRYFGFILTSTCGGFGAATAAAMAMGQSPDGLLDTWGIQYGQAGGNRQTFIEAKASTRFQPGLSARNGVVSAQLAACGLSGPHGAFEGDYGYLKVYTRAEDADPTALDAQIGERYFALDVSIKPYPSCRGTHGPVDLMGRVVDEHGIDWRDMERIEIHMPRNETGIFGLIGRPFVLKPDPHVDAQYSIPYTVAARARYGSMFLGELTDDRIADREVLALADRTTVTADLPAPFPKALSPVAMVVHLTNGERVEVRTDSLRGDPNLPMSRDDLVAKLESSVEYAASRGLRVHAGRIADAVIGVDRPSGLATLTSALRAG